jgi:hypothetical protein
LKTTLPHYVKAPIAIALAAICGCVAIACQSSKVIDPSDKVVLNTADASRLADGSIKIGMARAKIVDMLGRPQRTETYGNTEFLFYNVPWQFSLYADSSNPIAIKDGKVSGKGKIYYAMFSSKK